MIREYLDRHCISYHDIYDCRNGNVQIESWHGGKQYRTIDTDILIGWELDEMDANPYTLAQIDPAAIERQAMNEYMAIG